MAQVSSEAGAGGRAAILSSLEREIRKLTAQSVLFSTAISGRLGINSSDLECLDIVNLGGAATAGQLAAATGLSTGAITGVIDRLVKAGYVRRRRDAQRSPPGDYRTDGWSGTQNRSDVRLAQPGDGKAVVNLQRQRSGVDHGVGSGELPGDGGGNGQAARGTKTGGPETEVVIRGVRAGTIRSRVLAGPIPKSGVAIAWAVLCQALAKSIRR